MSQLTFVLLIAIAILILAVRFILPRVSEHHRPMVRILGLLGMIVLILLLWITSSSLP